MEENCKSCFVGVYTLLGYIDLENMFSFSQSVFSDYTKHTGQIEVKVCTRCKDVKFTASDFLMDEFKRVRDMAKRQRYLTRNEIEGELL